MNDLVAGTSPRSEKFSPNNKMRYIYVDKKMKYLECRRALYFHGWEKIVQGSSRSYVTEIDWIERERIQ